jgi:carnitine-CoA ligase
MTQVIHKETGTAWSAVASETVIDLMVESCKRNPTEDAMLFEDGVSLSRADLLASSQRFAGWLASRVAPGERVAIMLDTRIEYMIALFAIIAVRGVVVSINPDSKEHDARHILRDAGAVLAIVQKTTQPVIEGIRSECPDLRDAIILSDDEPRGLSAYASPTPFDFEQARCERTDIITIYYTSGTTGLSKGCMASHARWLRSADVGLRLAPRQRSDRTLCCNPFYYADALIQLLISLRAAGPMIVMRRFSISRFWHVVAQFAVTDLLLFASMPVLLLKAAPSQLERQHRVRFAVCVGIAPAFHQELVERFGFPWIDNYGSTEAGTIARVPLEHAERKIGSGSVGVPVPEVDVRIIDEDGHPVPAGSAWRARGTLPSHVQWISQSTGGDRARSARRLVPLRRSGAPG